MRTDRFPIGMFNCRTVAREGVQAVKDWDEAGITLAIGPSYDPKTDAPAAMTAMLDEAHARGLRVIHVDARTEFRTLRREGAQAYEAGFRKAVEEFGSHPALFGFFLGDEPDRGEFGDFCEAYRIHRKLAPDLTPYGNLLPHFGSTEARVGWADWDRYIGDFVAKAGPDFISYDCYVQMNLKNDRLDEYFLNLREFGDAARRRGLPWWTYLLCTGHYGYRSPNEDELRWQLSTAAAHGANGLFWFIFYNLPLYDDFRDSPIDEHGKRTLTYDRLSRTNRIFLKGHGAWLNRLSWRRSWHVGTAYGGFPLLDGSGWIRKARSGNGTPLVLSEFADEQGGRYLAVVNNSMDTPTQAEIQIVGERPAIFAAPWNVEGEEPLPFDEPVAPTASGEDFATIRFWMMPGGLELFKVADAAGKGA